MDDMKQMQDKLPEDNPSHVATIHYTKAYDMLKKAGRKELIYIMRYLLFLAKKDAVHYLPKLV